MKLGFVSAAFPDMGYEEVMDFAHENSLSCVEIACWPKGLAERKYAGVTHIDVSALDDEKAMHITNYAKEKGVEISALCYYPNPLDPDIKKREFSINHIKEIIKAAKKLNIKNVNTFIGKDKNKTIEENLDLFKKIWPSIIKCAEENDIRIGIENCAMYFTYNEWPGGCNLATSPAIWRKMFNEIPSPNFGLNFDPSHFIWQQMDYIRPIYEFRDKIFHIHIKDAKVLKNKLDDVGTQALPLEYFLPKLPGLGDVSWSRFISALTDINYKGAACIEIEDKAFEDSLTSRKNAVILSENYMKQFII